MGEDQAVQAFLTSDYFLNILDHFHDGIYITDSMANTIYLNYSYERISGLQKSEMLGRNMQELVDNGVISISGTLKVLESQNTFTTEQNFRTGKRAIITSFPIYNEISDRLVFVVTTVREITEIYSFRKELRRKERLNQKYSKELENIRKELEGNIDIVAVDNRSVSMLRFAERIAMVDSPVMILGEQGVGKEKIASFIHNHSPREKCMFMRLSFSTIPEDSCMEYLFGSIDKKKNESQMGILEAADGGTVYIDEIVEVPKEVQGRILSILNGTPCVMGDSSTVRLNIRFIIGTSKTIDELRACTDLCREILARFSVFPLTIPPLRERRDDIIPLLQFFLKKYNQKTGENKRFDRESYELLMAYKWPGNIQELQNLVERAAIISEEDIIGPEDLSVEGRIEFIHKKLEDFPEKINLKEEMEKFEADYMTRAFEKYKNTRAAAESLGMDNSTFVRKRQHYEDSGMMKRRPKKSDNTEL